MECSVCQGAPGESAPEKPAGGRRVGTQICATCGGPVVTAAMTNVESARGDTRIVESTATGQELRVSYMPSRAAHEEQRALVLAKSAYPALAALTQLPALAWRQPVVRSAVKTSAGAVALTVAVRVAGRVAGRVLASRGSREVARESLLPALADLIMPTEADARPARRSRRGRRARGEQVSEVFIYMRRTVQR